MKMKPNRSRRMKILRCKSAKPVQCRAKGLLMLSLPILYLLIIVASSEAKTLIVDPSGSGDAKKVSDAIALAGAGDEIEVRPGDYAGAAVDRSVSIQGPSDARAGQAKVSGALVVSAPGCRISDLSIKSSDSRPAVELRSSDTVLARCSIQGKATGIIVSGKNNTLLDSQVDSALGMEISGQDCRVLNSTLRGDEGIRMTGSSLNTIQGCRVLTAQGMEIAASNRNRIENNSLSGMSFGITLSGSSGNTIRGNNLSGSYLSGLDIVDSRENNVTGNRMTGGKLGISLRRSERNNLTANVCLRNERAGIYSDSSFDNRLEKNVLSGDGNGILLANSRDNLLLLNNASKNTYGISLRGSIRMVLRNNNMTANAYNLRVDAGEITAGAPSHYFYLHEIGPSNLVDGKPVCYLVGKINLEVPSSCGFVGLVSCRNARIANQTISNSTAGILLVNCTGCRIENAHVSSSESGVYLLNSTIWSVSGCRATACKTGFFAQGSTNGLFERDLASNSTENGFRADSSLNLTWWRCTARSGTKGISLVGSRLCSVNNCSVSRNKEAGISLSNSHRCTLQGNDASMNERGISLTGSNACLLSLNNGSSNKIDGISIMQLSSTEVLKNTARGNGQGIFVQSSNNLKIDGNTLTENSRYGLRMSGSSKCNVTENTIVRNQIAGANLVDCKGNLIYHNVFVDNGLQNAADNGANQWDAGPNVGGNYWSDHAVSGNPSSVIRKIPSSGVDRYPFQDPEGWR